MTQDMRDTQLQSGDREATLIEMIDRVRALSNEIREMSFQIDEELFGRAIQQQTSEDAKEPDNVREKIAEVGVNLDSSGKILQRIINKLGTN